MSIRSTIADIVFRLRALAAWTVVEVNSYREVERNDMTGAYRWRHINMNGQDDYNGPWNEGAPAFYFQRALCEAETTLADVAQMIAPAVNTIQGLDFGTDELTGFAIRRPNGTVITWKKGEAPPPEAAHLFP